MVKLEFGFFQVQVKRVPGHAIEFGHAPFRVAPKRFDAVDMLLPIRKFILAVVHAKVFVETDVDQSVIAAPAIGVDDGAWPHMSPDNALQRGFGAARHDFRIDFASPRFSKPNTMVLP